MAKYTKKNKNRNKKLLRNPLRKLKTKKKIKRGGAGVLAQVTDPLIDNYVKSEIKNYYFKRANKIRDKLKENNSLQTLLEKQNPTLEINKENIEKIRRLVKEEIDKLPDKLPDKISIKRKVLRDIRSDIYGYKYNLEKSKEIEVNESQIIELEKELYKEFKQQAQIKAIKEIFKIKINSLTYDYAESEDMKNKLLQEYITELKKIDKSLDENDSKTKFFEMFHEQRKFKKNAEARKIQNAFRNYKIKNEAKAEEEAKAKAEAEANAKAEAEAKAQADAEAERQAEADNTNDSKPKINTESLKEALEIMKPLLENTEDELTIGELTLKKTELINAVEKSIYNKILSSFGSAVYLNKEISNETQISKYYLIALLDFLKLRAAIIKNSILVGNIDSRKLPQNDTDVVTEENLEEIKAIHRAVVDEEKKEYDLKYEFEKNDGLVISKKEIEFIKKFVNKKESGLSSEPIKLIIYLVNHKGYSKSRINKIVEDIGNTDKSFHVIVGKDIGEYIGEYNNKFTNATSLINKDVSQLSDLNDLGRFFNKNGPILFHYRTQDDSNKNNILNQLYPIRLENKDYEKKFWKLYRVALIKLLSQTLLVSGSVKIKVLKKSKPRHHQTEPQDLQELMDKFNVQVESEYLYCDDANTEGSVTEEVEEVNKLKPDDTSNNINTSGSGDNEQKNNSEDDSDSGSWDSESDFSDTESENDDPNYDIPEAVVRSDNDELYDIPDAVVRDNTATSPTEPGADLPNNGKPRSVTGTPETDENTAETTNVSSDYVVMKPQGAAAANLKHTEGYEDMSDASGPSKGIPNSVPKTQVTDGNKGRGADQSNNGNPSSRPETRDTRWRPAGWYDDNPLDAPYSPQKPPTESNPENTKKKKPKHGFRKTKKRLRNIANLASNAIQAAQKFQRTKKKKRVKATPQPDHSVDSSQKNFVSKYKEKEPAKVIRILREILSYYDSDKNLIEDANKVLKKFKNDIINKFYNNFNKIDNEQKRNEIFSKLEEIKKKSPKFDRPTLHLLNNILNSNISNNEVKLNKFLRILEKKNQIFENPVYTSQPNFKDTNNGPDYDLPYINNTESTNFDEGINAEYSTLQNTNQGPVISNEYTSLLNQSETKLLSEKPKTTKTYKQLLKSKERN